MKKFNFKTILICVLALVLVFALVACNDGGGNTTKPNNPKDPTGPTDPSGPSGPTDPTKPSDTNKPVDISAAEFFTTLWDNASAIGSDVAIGKTDDVKLSVDLGVEAGVKARSNKKPVNSLELGVALDVVLDRSSDTTQNTAAKVALHLGDANILTLYYFVNDCNYLYLDFAGQQIKADVKLNDVNSQIKDVIKHYVIDTPIKTTDKNFQALNDKTPSGIIDMFVGDMGPEWSLNALIGKITTLFNFDLKKTIADDKTISGVLGLIGISADDLVDANGNISIEKILGNKTIGELFPSTKTEIDGGNHYSTRVTSTVFTLVGGLEAIKTAVPGLLGDGCLLDGNASVGFDYDIINDALANFTIAADLAGMTIGSGYPYVAVHINHLNFRKGNAATETMGISKASYKEKVAVELTEKLSFAGLTVDASKLGEAGINAAPKDIEVGLKATVGINDNAKTNANLWVSYGGSNIIEASYIGANKQLAVKLHRDVYLTSDNTGSVLDLIVKYAGKPIVDGLCAKLPGSAQYIRDFAAKLFADTNYTALKEGVVGAVWNNLDAAGMLKQKVFDVYMGKDFSLIELIEHPASKGYPSASSAADVEVKGINMTQLLNTVFSIAKFEDGKISITSEDAIADAAKFAQMFAASSAPEGGWTKANLIKLVKDEIKKAYANDPTGYEKWVVNIAQAIKMGNKSYTGTDAEAALNYLVDNVFNALELNLDLDFTQGMALTLEVKFSGASIKLEHNLTAYPTTGSTYVNYADSTSTAENGWIEY